MNFIWNEGMQRLEIYKDGQSFYISFEFMKIGLKKYGR